MYNIFYSIGGSGGSGGRIAIYYEYNTFNVKLLFHFQYNIILI